MSAVGILQGPAVLYEWVGVSGVLEGSALAVTTTLPGPVPAGATPIYQGQLVDEQRNAIPLVRLSALLLTIVDVLTGAVINNVERTNILNTGRGTVDSQGNFVVHLQAGDTSLVESPGTAQLERALVLDWTFTRTDTTTGYGRHQANMTIVALAQDTENMANATSSALDVTSATVIKAAPGTLHRIAVISAGSAGALTINDCTTVSGATTSNTTYEIANGGLSAGQVVDLNWPHSNGITVSTVTSGGVFNFSYE